MSTPMVRALLDGKKTQTRRAVKGAADEAGCVRVVTPWSTGLTETKALFFAGPTPESRGLADIRCPYGVPGDRLWVREAFYDHNEGQGRDPELVEYRATEWERDCLDFDAAWKPSIHMPRWASRLTLEITDVRVERLQAISQGDAIEEGVLTLGEDWLREVAPEYMAEWDRVGTHNQALSASGQRFGHTPPRVGPSPAQRYRLLWEQINGADSWNANPWVWVISFMAVQS